MKKYKDYWLENNRSASYRHFDNKVYLKNVIEQIDDESYIEKHAFMPFLRVEIKTEKYNRKTGIKQKIRNINYASHFDYLIYALYTHYIGNTYNEYAIKNKIDDAAIAYRETGKKTNIEYAKKAFDYIREHPNCIVFVGDFTDFFDSFNHLYLKKRLCNIFGLKELPEHIYKVYKSITKFSYVKKEQLINEIGIENIKEHDSKIISIQELRKKKHLIRQNKDKGVAQGISLSGILSNVYMTEFDKDCMFLAQHNNGLYLRYSDDFIFVFPNKKIYETASLFRKIKYRVNKVPNLLLQKDKFDIH